MFIDWYEILEIPQKVNAEEIRRAYRRLALKYHPDKTKDPEAIEKFNLLGRALEILSSPNTREQYDHTYEWYHSTQKKINVENQSDLRCSQNSPASYGQTSYIKPAIDHKTIARLQEEAFRLRKQLDRKIMGSTQMIDICSSIIVEIECDEIPTQKYVEHLKQKYNASEATWAGLKRILLTFKSIHMARNCVDSKPSSYCRLLRSVAEKQFTPQYEQDTLSRLIRLSTSMNE